MADSSASTPLTPCLAATAGRAPDRQQLAEQDLEKTKHTLGDLIKQRDELMNGPQGQYTAGHR